MTYIFIAEMGLKILVMGPINYLWDKMNYLDAGVVLLSIIEMTVLNQGGTGKKTSFNAFRSVRIFRTFWVLWVAWLLKGMKSMQLIVAVIAWAMNSFIYLAMLCFLFVFIYALLGMQLFGGNMNPIPFKPF